MDYQKPQIATMYELANPLGQDAEFYLALAGPQSCRVLDLGCGTGTLCCSSVAIGGFWATMHELGGFECRDFSTTIYPERTQSVESEEMCV